MLTSANVTMSRTNVNADVKSTLCLATAPVKRWIVTNVASEGRCTHVDNDYFILANYNQID